MDDVKVENPCLATIQPAAGITSVNARAGAGRHYEVVQQLDAGTTGLRVVDTRPDEASESRQGRVFQWLRLILPDGREGWVRDDLVMIEGDCRAQGYGELAAPVRAASLEPKPIPDGPEPEPMTAEEMERARKAAYAITAGYEGRGYDTYQNYDSGVVSYGRFQFTLASGSLEKVLDRYLETAKGPSPDQLRDKFMARVREKDPALRNDEAFRKLLLGLAADPVMHAAQDSYVTDTYWNTVLVTSMKPRGIQTPLGQAFVFDMAVNHGSWGTESTYLRGAEQALGVDARSKLGENGITEAKLLYRAAMLRKERLYALANARGWGGLKPRADFWLERMDAGDWNLQGDENGEVAIRPDAKVQVREPF
ncbi:MAG: chitosanase [Anaerolineae bacterium]